MIILEERIRKVLAEAYGEKKFDFSAIIEREDAGARWDLAVSAKWINDHDFIETMAPILPKVLSDSELIRFGRLVVLDPDGEFMDEFNQRRGPNRKDDRDFCNLLIAGIPVRRAYVFGSESPMVFA